MEDEQKELVEEFTKSAVKSLSDDGGVHDCCVVMARGGSRIVSSVLILVSSCSLTGRKRMATATSMRMRWRALQRSRTR